eukprot:3980518-Amphidinium_carterae.1
MMRAAGSEETAAFWMRVSTAQLYLSSLKSEGALQDGSVVGGDAAERHERKRDPNMAESSGQRKPKAPCMDRSARTGDGTHTMNRAGADICPKLNTPEGCKPPCPLGKMHQCAVCLKMGHSAVNCWEVKGRPTKSKGKGSGGIPN